MSATFQFSVNGESHTVETEPDRSLLDVIREDLQLTGAKYGCGEGECRACTVLMDGRPITLMSATEDAPARLMTSCASAIRSGISAKKGCTSAAISAFA